MKGKLQDQRLAPEPEIRAHKDGQLSLSMKLLTPFRITLIGHLYHAARAIWVIAIIYFVTGHFAGLHFGIASSSYVRSGLAFEVSILIAPVAWFFINARNRLVLRFVFGQRVRVDFSAKALRIRVGWFKTYNYHRDQSLAFHEEDFVESKLDARSLAERRKKLGLEAYADSKALVIQIGGFHVDKLCEVMIGREFKHFLNNANLAISLTRSQSDRTEDPAEARYRRIQRDLGKGGEV